MSFHATAIKSREDTLPTAFSPASQSPTSKLMSRQRIDDSRLAGNNCAETGGGIAVFFAGSVVVVVFNAIASATEEERRGGDLQFGTALAR